MLKITTILLKMNKRITIGDEQGEREGEQQLLMKMIKRKKIGTTIDTKNDQKR
jgi:hypothetical protein